MINVVAIPSAVAADTGRKETFLRLISTYQAALHRLAAAYASDPQDREDIVQEIAVALWVAIPRFRGESSERTWLYRIAHNIAITASMKLRRKANTESELDENTMEPPTAVHADEQIIEKQKHELLMQAVRELPATDRQVLALHLEDLSHREIQEITGISEGALATRLSRMRERLRERLLQRIQQREANRQ